MRHRNVPWTLSRQAFDRLLEALSPNRAEAADRYQHLRRALVRFFECRGGRVPDEHADEVLNRIARKLEAGVVLDDLHSYSHGVARHVLLEVSKQRPFEPLDPDGVFVTADPGDAARETQLLCLDTCMKALPASDRELILEYHRLDGAEKIHARQKLATRLGIVPNALRIRAHRIRLKLETCVRECVRGGSSTK